MEFDVALSNVKFLRIFATQSSNQRGYSLYEFEVYRPALSGFEEKELIPSGFKLFQNYPNPFNPETVISYQIPEYTQVKIIVYDILGREVTTLINKEQNPGTYEFKFSFTDELSSGIYLYSIKAGDFFDTKKMILLR
jgi:hypothetical protein